MTPVEWLRRWLLAPPPARGWAEDCPAGLPVPAGERCAAADCDSVPLPALAEGDRGHVTCLEQPGGAAAATLSGLGILPGVEVELVQRFPAFVLRIGYAEVGLDEQLACRVRVRRSGDSHARFMFASPRRA